MVGPVLSAMDYKDTSFTEKPPYLHSNGIARGGLLSLTSSYPIVDLPRVVTRV